MVVGALAVIAMVALFMQASKIRCPVCIGRLFGSSGCSKHEKAKVLFGSTRLGIIVQAIFAISDVRCRFCGVHLRRGRVKYKRPAPNIIDEFHAWQARPRPRMTRPAQPRVNVMVPAERPPRRRWRGGRAPALH